MIRVRFLEDETDNVLHETEIAPDALPDLFAIEMWWYGVEREGKLKALCLGGDTSAGLIGIDGLVLVDWCRCYRKVCGTS